MRYQSLRYFCINLWSSGYAPPFPEANCIKCQKEIYFLIFFSGHKHDVSWKPCFVFKWAPRFWAKNSLWRICTLIYHTNMFLKFTFNLEMPTFSKIFQNFAILRPKMRLSFWTGNDRAFYNIKQNIQGINRIETLTLVKVAFESKLSFTTKFMESLHS